jgi:hypothetical protein
VSERVNTAPHPTAPCLDELRRLVQRNVLSVMGMTHAIGGSVGMGSVGTSMFV